MDLVKVKCDSPLSTNGYKLANMAAKVFFVKIEHLLKEGLDICFWSSPYIRTLETCIC